LKTQYCLCGLVITGSGYPITEPVGGGGRVGSAGLGGGGQGVGRFGEGFLRTKKSPHWAGFKVWRVLVRTV